MRNNRMQMKQNNFGAKYRNWKNNRKVEWINKRKELQELEEGSKTTIDLDILRTTLKNTKLKNSQSMMAYINDRLTIEMNKCLKDTDIPKWINKGKTNLIQYDSQIRTTPNSNRHVTCLPMVWKILTAQLREEIYYSLLSCGLFPEEQKGCHKRTGILQYVDQHIFNTSSKRAKWDAKI